ncbi:MAG: hypothetical protein WKF43_16345 [Acidimicrobiales bacterium]
MRALLSVHDKTGVVELARGLVALGWELVASRSTAAALVEADLPVTDVADITGFPPILGHRVVTLHPKIHGGLLADRSDPEHVAEMERYGIGAIDLVVSNLYPFESDPGIDLIDIGGPALIRAAAKNHAHVGVLVDQADYPAVLDELRTGAGLSAATRLGLAAKAYATTSAYDARVAAWLDGEVAHDGQRARPAVAHPRDRGRQGRPRPALRREPAPAGGAYDPGADRGGTG